LSIIIPSLGNVPLLEQGLVSVLTHRPDDCEIFIVLNERYADPYDLRDEVRFVDAPRGAGWSASVWAALTQTESPLVHILEPGVGVTEGWCETALREFADPSVAAVAPLVLSAPTRSKSAIVGIDYRVGGRPRPHRVQLAGQAKSATVVEDVFAPDRSGMFFRADLLRVLLSGATEIGDEWINVELGLALRGLGLKTRHAAAVQIVDARRTPRRRPTVEEAFRRAQGVERLFWRNAPTNGWTRSLLAHGAVVLSELWPRSNAGSMFVRLAGRVAAMRELDRYRDHWHRLDDLRHELRSTMPGDCRLDRAHEWIEVHAPATLPPRAEQHAA